MDQSVELWTRDEGEPWPWALIFVLLGWVGLAWMAGRVCLTGGRLLKEGTRWALETGGACMDLSRTSCRTRVPSQWARTGPGTEIGGISVETQTEGSPRPSAREATSPPRHRCSSGCTGRGDTPRREGCVYSTHPRQLGSPDLVKAMACRARYVLKDLARGSRTESWEGER